MFAVKEVTVAVPAQIEFGLLAEVIEIRHGRNYGFRSHRWALPLRPSADAPYCSGASMSHLAAFVGIAALVIVTPGQDTALTIRNTLVGGRRGGVRTVLGVASGNAVWTLAASAGIAAIVAASEPAFLALRLAGAAYLVFLGAQTLVAALRGGKCAKPTFGVRLACSNRAPACASREPSCATSTTRFRNLAAAARKRLGPPLAPLVGGGPRGPLRMGG